SADFLTVLETPDSAMFWIHGSEKAAANRSRKASSKPLWEAMRLIRSRLRPESDAKPREQLSQECCRRSSIRSRPTAKFRMTKDSFRRSADSCPIGAERSAEPLPAESARQPRWRAT